MTTLELINSYNELPAQQQQEILEKAVNTLAELFPVQAVEPVYSVGFQRWQKLSKKQYIALHKKFGFNNGNMIKEMLQTKTAKELLA